MKRNLIRLGGVLLVVLVTLISIDYFFYHRFISRLRSDTLPPWPLAGPEQKVPLELWKQVGYLRNRKASSFLRAKIAKPHGKIRVCAFGDSFTLGSEVDNQRDYPTLLQKLIDETDPGRVQVINFGIASFGFHQAYLLWAGYGRQYGCDYLLLGPGTFVSQRDTTFQNAGNGKPYYLHARFVLAGDDVKLIEVRGDTLAERFADYYSFVPRLDYLRYDSAPPAFLRALLAPRKTIPNPFYYRPTPKLTEEAQRTYEILLRHMMDAGARIVLADRSVAEPAAPGVTDGHLQRVEAADPRWFPYRAPGSHFSGIGNQLLAGRFRAGLTGEPGIPLLLPGARPVATPPPSDSGPPLSAHDAVWLSLDGAPIAHFVHSDAPKREASPSALKRQHIAALLEVGEPEFAELGKDDWTPEGCWLALAQPLTAGEPVMLQIGGEEHEIGRVALLADGINVGIIEPHDTPILDRGWLSESDPLTVRGTFGPKAGAGKRATLLFKGAPLLMGKVVGNTVQLKGPRDGCWRPRADANGFVDVRALPDSGTFDLTVSKSDKVRTFPIASWKKVADPGLAGASPLAGPLAGPLAH